MNFIKNNNLIKRTKFRNKYRIESTRLKNYDYSRDGAYFITICTKNRKHYFGEIINHRLQTTEQSKICLTCWRDLPKHYPNCILDAFVIMPDHVHMIIFIKNNVNNNDQHYQKYQRLLETGYKPVSTRTGRGYYNEKFITINEILINKQFKPYPVSEIIRGFKTFTARKINELQNTPGQQFWQTRFHDHIIRNEYELNRIRKYIVNNPFNFIPKFRL